MTTLPHRPQDDRKDTLTVTAPRPGQDACLLGGHGMWESSESVMAFLMRLYAYFLAHFTDEVAGEFAVMTHISQGTTKLKAELMRGGHYQFRMVRTDVEANPHALTVKTLPPNKDGKLFAKYAVLWPRAFRERYIETGRIVSTFKVVTERLVVSVHAKCVRVYTLLTERTRAAKAACGVLSSIRNTDTTPEKLVPP